LQRWLFFNPLTVPIEASRSLLIHGKGFNIEHWAWHTAACLAILWIGWWVFQRARRGFADVI
jgi:lipopolysaccharide transport system permease protein